MLLCHVKSRAGTDKPDSNDNSFIYFQTLRFTILISLILNDLHCICMNIQLYSSI